jgi:hypothetical protein
MILLYISGFPRSATTYLQRWLLSSKSCFGIDEEQGLDVIWKNMQFLKNSHFDDVTASLWSVLNKLPEQEKERIRANHWMGVFVWKNMQVLGSKFLDGWCWGALNDRTLIERMRQKYFVVKTPSFTFSPGWPENFVKESKLFSDYRVIVAIRNPEELLYSGHKQFPFWTDQNVTAESLYKDWLTMYTTAQNKPEKWLIVRHSDLMNHTEDTLAFLTEKLGIKAGPPMKFRATSLNTPQWMSPAQREVVENIMNGSNVLKVRLAKRTILKSILKEIKKKLRAYN